MASLITYLDRAYTSVVDRRPVLKRIRAYSLKRLFIRTLANMFIFLLALKRQFVSHVPKVAVGSNKNGVIVSLTSFPERISSVSLVIETIMDQTYVPEHIVLWLAREQFDGYGSLPSQLREQMKRGLKIEFKAGDLRSHKKYVYSIRKYKACKIVTIDDDILYPDNFLQELISEHNKNPDDICCNRGVVMLWDKGVLTPYKYWPLLTKNCFSSFDTFFTSGGGTLFPANVFKDLVFNDADMLAVCPTADDVWLNAMCRIANRKITKTNFVSDCLPVMRFGNISLSRSNVQGGGNDRQIVAVIEYCWAKYGLDPFRINYSRE